MRRRYLFVIVITMGMTACKNAQRLAHVQPSGTIDSIGDVTVRHSREISYIPVGDTLIYRDGLPLLNYRDADSTIVLEGGKLTVRLPRPAAQHIRDATTVQIPVFKENLDRIRGLQQKADSLQAKNQQVTGQLSRLKSYKVIVWTIAGCLVGIIILVIAIMWLKGKFGWIGSGVKNIFGWATRLLSRKK